ncbi:MAG: YchJ family metal-binding protein [Byssovorax sp.]
MPRADDCPCCSGLRYRDCCQPFHRGDREAPTPEALMRSRYAAFARKEAAYLVRTLHPDHPDRARPEAEILASIRASAGAYRYMGLQILDQRPEGEDGLSQVLFFAKIFEKGRDRSFVELSDFAHDGEGFRYRDGQLVPVERLGRDPRTLTIPAFEAIFHALDRRA